MSQNPDRVFSSSTCLLVELWRTVCRTVRNTRSSWSEELDMVWGIFSNTGHQTCLDYIWHKWEIVYNSIQIQLSSHTHHTNIHVYFTVFWGVWKPGRNPHRHEFHVNIWPCMKSWASLYKHCCLSAKCSGLKAGIFEEFLLHSKDVCKRRHDLDHTALFSCCQNVVSCFGEPRIVVMILANSLRLNSPLW